ncbi:MAG: penicillin acylase family protein, partial [bacterium]|nr:penicillin acylase family protein [bacterium]
PLGSWHTGSLFAQDDDSSNIVPVDIAGLDGTVSISRDEWGVPTIKAESDRDLFVGYGYAIAQDRLWQMDGSRRLARGQVAEVAGQSQLHWDIYHRSLGLGRAADESVETLEPVTHEYLQAFSDGVNAYIDTHRGNLPFEFLLMNYEPAPWTVGDCLAITRLVAVWLAADSWDEEEYGTLINELGEEEASALFPPIPSTEPHYIFGQSDESELISSNNGKENADVDNGQCEDRTPCFTLNAESPACGWKGDSKGKIISEWFEPLEEIGINGHLNASNVWAVDGSMTESGEPILAMDPHLNYFAPSILYEVVLDGVNINCWGVSFPGMPFLPFGANEKIAWGASNLPADCQDLFVEQLNPENQNQYQVDGQWLDFEISNEQIVYKDNGGIPRSYSLTLYRSIHGPVIYKGAGTCTAMKWTGIEPSDDVTGFRLAMSASSIEEFYEAFRGYHSPAQNVCLIEKGEGGRIAQILIGDVPIRSGYDGRSPVSGIDSSLDWTGYIPYDELPHRIDPPEGYVAHANNIPLGGIKEDGSRPLGASFSSNERIDRIIELLNSNPGHLTFDDMRNFQMDDVDLTARFFVPELLEAIANEAGNIPEGLSGYIDPLSGWDYRLAKDSVTATIYQVWLLKLIQSCMDQGLPPGDSSYLAYEDRWIPILEDYIRGETNLDWLKGDSSAAIDHRLVTSLDQAVGELQSALGPDTINWQWGDVNQSVFPHPSGVENLIGAGSHPWGGGRYTIRVGYYSYISGPPYVNDFGTVFRAVVASEGGSWRIGAVLPPGEGGAAFLPHGMDQMDLWLEGGLREVSYGTSGTESVLSGLLEPLQ